MSARALDRRVWVWGGVLVALLLVAGSWLVVIGPHRSTTDQLREDAASVQLQNDILAGRTAALRRQAGDRSQLQTQLGQALQQLPADSNLPAFSRQLAAQARTFHVTVTSISVGSSTLASTTSSTPAAPGATAAAGSTLEAIPITILTDGTGLDQLRFLREIQRSGPRRALVTGTSLAAKDKNSIAVNSIMTTQLMVFSSSLSADDRARLASLLGSDEGSD